jgi:hypothetical protein
MWSLRQLVPGAEGQPHTVAAGLRGGANAIEEAQTERRNAE